MIRLLRDVWRRVEFALFGPPLVIHKADVNQWNVVLRRPWRPKRVIALSVLECVHLYHQLCQQPAERDVEIRGGVFARPTYSVLLPARHRFWAQLVMADWWQRVIEKPL